MLAGLLPDMKYHEIGKKIINDLLKYKKLDLSKFARYFSKDLEEILGKYIFAYNHDHTITFQSRSIEYYIEENFDTYVKKKK
jgi:hypothetical protein